MGGDDTTVKTWLRKVRVGRVLENTPSRLKSGPTAGPETRPIPAAIQDREKTPNRQTHRPL